MVKLMKCKTCGSIVEVVIPGTADTCCNEEREELLPNTQDAAVEKHVPEVTVDGNIVTVVVGSTEHPMMPEHHITNIWLETTVGVQRANLDPEGKPCAVFVLPEGVSAIAAYEYCNLHGFWKKEL